MAIYPVLTITLDVYGHGAKVKKYKGYRVLAQQAPNTLTLSNKVQHARRRRVVAQAFSETSLRRFEPKVQSVLERFCQHLRSAVNESAENGWTSPRDISKDCKFSHSQPKVVCTDHYGCSQLFGF